MRKILRKIIEETIRNMGNKPQILNKYLKPFDEGRQLDPMLKDLPVITLEFINFHKNWQDVAQFNDIENWMSYGPEIYSELNNFRLLRLEYY
jgi:hypothetical protein